MEMPDFWEDATYDNLFDSLNLAVMINSVTTSLSEWNRLSQIPNQLMNMEQLNRNKILVDYRNI